MAKKKVRAKSYLEADQVAGGWNVNYVQPEPFPSVATRVARIDRNTAQELSRSEWEVWAKRIVHAVNSHEVLCRTLGEIATSVAFALASRKCPAKMRPGLQAIVDAATGALDKVDPADHETVCKKLETERE